MIQAFPRDLEKEIWEKCIPYLKNCRRDDVEHTERTVVYGRELMQHHNNANPSIIIPSLIGHDTGYSKLFEKYETNHTMAELKLILPFPEIQALHMQYGAEIIERVLNGTKYTDKFGVQKTQKAVKIVSIHDYPRKVFDWGDTDAIVVVEADRLDRYDPKRMSKDSFPEKSDSWILEWLEKGLNEWFVTKHGTSYAKKLYDKQVERLRRQKAI
jgi:hypothetical protein